MHNSYLVYNNQNSSIPVESQEEITKKENIYLPRHIFLEIFHPILLHKIEYLIRLADS